MKYRVITVLRLTLLLLSLGLAGFVPALLSAPQVQTYQGIPYLSGGIAEEERAALRELDREYNVKLVFAIKAGNYVSGVHITIEDGQGKTVLEAISNGPWFYTRLPAGKYAIMAQAEGQIRRQVARVEQQKQTQLQFYW